MQKFVNYLNHLSEINNLGNGVPVKWQFHCGMLFLAENKWWGDFKIRNSVHEGIDIVYYASAMGKWHKFDETVLIPSMGNGVVLNICDDFLGRTVVMKSFWPGSGSNETILLAYAHVKPMKEIHIGSVVSEKSVLATVCGTEKNPCLVPHLHLSCFEVPSDIPTYKLNWDLFSKSKYVRLINPVFL